MCITNKLTVYRRRHEAFPFVQLFSVAIDDLDDDDHLLIVSSRAVRGHG